MAKGDLGKGAADVRTHWHRPVDRSPAPRRATKFRERNANMILCCKYSTASRLCTARHALSNCRVYPQAAYIRELQFSIKYSIPNYNAMGCRKAKVMIFQNCDSEAWIRSART